MSKIFQESSKQTKLVVWTGVIGQHGYDNFIYNRKYLQSCSNSSRYMMNNFM